MSSTTGLPLSRHDHSRLNAILRWIVDAADLRLRTDLRRLSRDLRRAEIIPPEEIPPDVVTLNSRARVLNLESGEEETWLLTLPREADLARGKLSVLSPVGTALLGARAGETVRWENGGNSGRLKVLEILFQPEAAGRYEL